VVILRLVPRRDGIPAVQPRGHAAECLLRLLQLAGGDGEKPVGAERDAFVQLQLLLELLAAEAEGAFAARGEIALQIVDVACDRARRFGRGVSEIPEQMQVAQVAEGAGQIFVDEAQCAAHALETHLDVNAGRVPDVVAGRLDDARNLAQLGEDAAGALGERRILEERLPGKTRREDLRVVLRTALPGADRLELEQPRTNARVERRSLETLGVGEAGRVNGRQPARETAEIANLTVDALTAQILEEVVMQVNAIERRAGWMGLIEVRQVLVNEVRQGFG